MKNHRILSRTTFLKLGLGAVIAPFVSGCTPAAVPISRSPNDPSSPSAPAGKSPLIASATQAEHHHTNEATDGIVYVCPMHPEVTSTKAGELCPKCNMKLVPKK